MVALNHVKSRRKKRWGSKKLTLQWGGPSDNILILPCQPLDSVLSLKQYPIGIFFMLEITKEEEFIKIAKIISLALLIIHTGLLIFFFANKVYFMAVFSIASILTYIGTFSLIKAKKIRLYIITLLLEVLLHMIMATVCVGWQSGFPLYAFALISIVYYLKYISPSSTFSKLIPHIVIILMGSTFFGLRLYTYFFKPIYTLSDNTNKCIYLVNTIFVFVFVAEFLYQYTNNILENEQDLQSQAEFDELTQLYNRRKMHDILRNFSENSYTMQKNYTITIMDIDNFKLINDRYGHDAGDYVLKTIAKIMKRVCKEIPEVDVCRWGGEEFLLAQTWNSTTDSDFATCKKTISIIHNSVDSYSFDYNGIKMHVTMTAGIAAHEIGEMLETTINHADQRLYWGKAHGKNRIVDAN